MSLTTHLASMPHRAEAKASSTPVPAPSITARSKSAVITIKRIGKALVMLTGGVFVIGAIIAFKTWMWWPYGQH